MRRLPRLTMWQPTLTFTIVARSAGGLSTFSCVVSLSSVSEALHLPLGCRSQPQGLIGVTVALQLPKPRFVFAFDGALLPFTYNGDKFVLLALLPRMNPREDHTVQLPSCSCRHYHGGVSKNSTSPARGYSDSHVLLAAGMDFCFIGDKASPLHLSLILPSEVYSERARLAPRFFVLASPSGRGSAALAGRAVFVVALRAPLPSI